MALQLRVLTRDDGGRGRAELLARSRLDVVICRLEGRSPSWGVVLRMVSEAPGGKGGDL